MNVVTPYAEVIRRVGGLEVRVWPIPTTINVIRRVGGLEVYASNAEKFGEVIRRVGGLEVFKRRDAFDRIAGEMQ